MTINTSVGTSRPALEEIATEESEASQQDPRTNRQEV